MSKTFAKATAYPLAWPPGFPVTERPQTSKFSTTLFQALENVQEALRKFASDSGKKVSDVIISSNYSLSESKPRKAGVAVYFTWDGDQTCIPVDRYQLVEDNLQAIYHCIEAERTKLRHGGINLVKAAFRGYAALPNPEAKVNWREFFGYPEGRDLQEVKKLYQRAASVNHPDKGGNAEQFHQVQVAWEAAQRELMN